MKTTQVGYARFPATRSSDGKKVLAAFCTTEVFCTPAGASGVRGFARLPKATESQTTSFYITATVLMDGARKDNDENVKSTNKANMFAVSQALDFAVSVFGERITHLDMNVYIKVDAPIETACLGGTSLGLATSIALLGFNCKNIDYVFTGYVNNQGNALQGEEALEVIVQAIDEAPAKVVGCVASKTSLVLPYLNHRDVLGPYEKAPAIPGWTGVVYREGPKARLLNIVYYRGRDVVKIVFVNTMRDAVSYLTSIGLQPTM